MLVLSRDQDEAIIIGDNIVLTVQEFRGAKVRVHVSAPKKIPVYRAELGSPTSKRRSNSRKNGSLIISRKKGEEIIIGRNIAIMVVNIRDEKVRFGISAPRDIPVHRKEVYDAIREERRRKA